jgi:hypothetical protein
MRENTTTIGGKTQQLSAGKTQQLPAGKNTTIIGGKNTTTTGGKNTTIIGGKKRWEYRPFIASGHLIVRVLLPTASVEGGYVSSHLHPIGHVQCTWSSSEKKGRTVVQQFLR